ncbi:MAG: glutathione S-transferase N-terminal domain-containing protein [Steroidobacteraceae bacterium]
MIDFYFWPTPNGKKVAILLEELAVPYRIIPVNIGKGDQFAPEYLKISPNNRMPAIVDTEPLGDDTGGGAPISIFESGAILMYLAEKYGRFWPQTPREKYEVTQWIMWQMSNQGPKFGENGHFRRAADKPENGNLAYARKRFDDEVNRLYGVMNIRLYDRPYLAGNEYSIADIVAYPWANGWERQGQDINEFKHVKRWLEAVGQRPAVQRAMQFTADGAQSDETKLTPEEAARRTQLLHNQRARSAPG